MYYVGLMSGTSMDAIDCALIQTETDQLDVLQYQEFPLSKDLQSKLRSINAASSIDEITELDVTLGALFAEATLKIIELEGLSPNEVTAIGSHGQTVIHLPDDTHPRTLQIGDPNIIAYQTGITTVADFRRMNIAAGGQGAPLAPIFHQQYFKNTGHDLVILNIGGIANITLLNAGNKENNITGFDTGPGNGLMDAWIQKHLQQDFDKDGEWALSGKCHQALLSALSDDDYFDTAPPKSTGKDFFNLAWLENKLAVIGETIQAEDVQATLLELSAKTISEAIIKYAESSQEVLVCGGGVHNKLLIQQLSERLPNQQINSTEKYGLNPDAVEAVAFAWLAKCRMENQCVNATSITGSDEDVLLGNIFQAKAQTGN